MKVHRSRVLIDLSYIQNYNTVQEFGSDVVACGGRGLLLAAHHDLHPLMNTLFKASC